MNKKFKILGIMVALLFVGCASKEDKAADSEFLIPRALERNNNEKSIMDRFRHNMSSFGNCGNIGSKMYFC